MKSRLFAGLAAGAATVAYAAYLKDIKTAKRRVETGAQTIDSIEFAESGDGPSVLVVHGAGGGFDQGLDLGRSFLGDGYRVIAPSRFGYLGTPLPADASADAQAEAYVRLLDALQLERVPVIGVSAGGPSALQFCLKHPERCSALVLIVPMVYAPDRPPVRTLSPSMHALLDFILESDFVFWTMMKVAHSTMVKTILGTPVEVYRNATIGERRAVDEMLQSILPISRRAAGLANEGAIASTLTPSPIEEIRVPALLISAADDLYGTYENSIYTAKQIPHAKLVTFPTGGHLLVGHDAEVRAEVRSLLEESRQSQVA